MTPFLLAIGLVLILEGLVFALAPSRLEDLLKALEELPIDARRMLGVLCVIAGTILIIMVRAWG